MARVERAARADEEGTILDWTVVWEGGLGSEFAVHVDLPSVLFPRPSDDDMPPRTRPPGGDVAHATIVVQIALLLGRAKGESALVDVLVEHAPVRGTEEGAVDVLVISPEVGVQPEAGRALVGTEVAVAAEDQGHCAHVVALAHFARRESLLGSVDQGQDGIRLPPELRGRAAPSDGGGGAAVQRQVEDGLGQLLSQSEAVSQQGKSADGLPEREKNAHRETSAGGCRIAVCPTIGALAAFGLSGRKRGAGPAPNPAGERYLPFLLFVLRTPGFHLSQAGKCPLWPSSCTK